MEAKNVKTEMDALLLIAQRLQEIEKQLANILGELRLKLH